MERVGKAIRLVLLALAVGWCSVEVNAGDADITSDFVVPEGVDPGSLGGEFFAFSGFRSVVAGNSSSGGGGESASVSKATQKEFAALEGQSVSYAILQFPAGAVNPPHVHPRAAELLLVVKGWLDVGFVDTTNKLFQSTLQTGDLFVFPKGLLHFQINPNAYQSATAISAFGSSDAGTISLPAALFATQIPQDVLAKSFKTTPSVISQLHSAFNSSS